MERRRLLEVRGLHPAMPVLVLHPLLTVVTGFGRDASDSVVECMGRLGAPLGPSVTGTVEIGGRILELPGALTDPGSRPEVVRSPMIVSEIVRRRAALAAADLSQRAARVSRREAGLARRDQLVDRLERLSNRADVLEAQLTPESDIDDEIEELLRAVHEVVEPTEPNPIAATLIEEWEALVVERKSTGSGPTVQRAEANVEAARARIDERRLAVAGGNGSPVLSAEGVARVQECHGAVERIAASMEDGKRAERKAAGQQLGAALDAEREALSDLGFDSYAAFLLAMAEGRAEGDGGHDQAALRTAEAALVRAHEREAAFVELSERELDLRARVARMLGRLPGPDVGAELRTGRDTAATMSNALERLAGVLRNAGAPVGDDPVAAAEQWLVAAELRRSERAALMAELAEIESEGSRLDEQLEEAESEVAAAERELIAGVSGALAGREAPVVLAEVEPEELASTFASLMSPDGPPLVIGECFDELTPPACTELLEVLGTLSQTRQVIVVTEHPNIGRWAQGLGIVARVWTPDDALGVDLLDDADTLEADANVVVTEAAVTEAVATEAVATDSVETVAVEPAAVAEAASVETVPHEAVVADVAVADVVETSAPWNPFTDDAEVDEFEAGEPQDQLVESDPVDPELLDAAVSEVEAEALVTEPTSLDEPEPAVDEVRDRFAPALFDFEAVEAAELGAPEIDADDEDAFFTAARARQRAAEAVEALEIDEDDEVEAIEVTIAEPAEIEAPRGRTAPTPPEPRRADGPSKTPRRSRRKKDTGPAPAPWEGRFDTSRIRELPTAPRSKAVAPDGTEPLAVCARHRGVLTRTRCSRCGVPACDECLISAKGKRRTMCVECAIIESGVRRRRRNG